VINAPLSCGSFVNGDAGRSRNLTVREKEAATFASTALIPDDEFEAFARAASVSAAHPAFAAKQEIAPALSWADSSTRDSCNITSRIHFYLSMVDRLGVRLS
jgi:hypothetical protein